MKMSLAQRELVIGIDLGTTNTCVAIYQNGRAQSVQDATGESTTPSYVGFHEDGRLFGRPAKDNAFINPTNTVFSVKRIIGRRIDDPEVVANTRRWPFEVVDIDGDVAVKVEDDGKTKVFRPEEISAMFLRYIKETAETSLQCTIKKAVITVPAGFSNGQRRATKLAGEMAGLEVIGMINEPTAAAVAYGLQSNGQKTILVFDFGGGTLDISILHISDGRVFKVLATSGFMQLGGDDLDQRIIDLMKDRFEKANSVKLSHVLNANQYREVMSHFREKAEKAKIALSSGKSSVTVTVDHVHRNNHLKTQLTSDDFESACQDIFPQILVPIKEALQDAQLCKEDIDQIVIVGGSSRVPQIQRTLREFFPNKKLHQDINPAEAVAFGAAVYAQSLVELTKSDVSVDLQEILPRSLGVVTLGGRMNAIIDKHTRIPCQKSKIFTTAHDCIPKVNITVYEGEAPLAHDNILLDQFDLTGIQVAKAGVPQIEVVFQYDSDGILHVSARDLGTGQSAKIAIKRSGKK